MAVEVVRKSYLCPHATRGYRVKLQCQGYTARHMTDNNNNNSNNNNHEKSQLNRLVWSSLMLAPINGPSSFPSLFLLPFLSPYFCLPESLLFPSFLPSSLLPFLALTFSPTHSFSSGPESNCTVTVGAAGRGKPSH